jgi:hypothetical protein
VLVVLREAFILHLASRFFNNLKTVISILFHSSEIAARSASPSIGHEKKTGQMIQE